MSKSLVLAKINEIRAREAKKAAEEIAIKTREIVVEACEVITEMVPKALDVIYEALDSDERLPSDKLRAALAVLGMIGITPTKRVELISKDGDLDKKQGYFDELKRELVKQVEVAQCRGSGTILVTDQARTLSKQLT